ncbi:MAG: hypothetical protein IPN08_10210 [Bacteroidales bacterium]|nr:hypothetical protein [Bacteroidales bacterium]
MSFNERTGLPAKTVSYRGLMVDSRNRLWVGTVVDWQSPPADASEEDLESGYQKSDDQ